jgi:hypothetical protein
MAAIDPTFVNATTVLGMNVRKTAMAQITGSATVRVVTETDRQAGHDTTANAASLRDAIARLAREDTEATPSLSHLGDACISVRDAAGINHTWFAKAGAASDAMRSVLHLLALT